MTDKQKEAIENLRKILFTTMQANECGLSNNDFKTEIKTYTDILGVIENQQAEIENLKTRKERQLKRFSKYKENIENKHEEIYEDLVQEIEKQDKRISDLEFALMDMVLQFADENKDSINTMGLSALETAFNELNFDNPMSIKEVHKRYKELAQKYYQ